MLAGIDTTQLGLEMQAHTHKLHVFIIKIFFPHQPGLLWLTTVNHSLCWWFGLVWLLTGTAVFLPSIKALPFFICL
jgi:hypothetical protein